MWPAGYWPSSYFPASYWPKGVTEEVRGACWVQAIHPEDYKKKRLHREDNEILEIIMSITLSGKLEKWRL